MLSFARNRSMALAEGALVAVLLAIVFGLVGWTAVRSRAASSWTSPEGTVINVDSGGSWTTNQIYRLLVDNGLDSVVGPTLTVNVQDVYSSQTATSVSHVGTTYQNYRATIWLDGRPGSTFASLPEYVAGHEFGHA